MKKRITNPEENRAVFLNVHEPIIDRVTWEKVQALQKGTRRRKSTKSNVQTTFQVDLNVQTAVAKIYVR